MGGAMLGARYCPSAEEVEAAFGDLSKREVEEIRREVTSLECRNAAVETVFRKHGLEPLLPLVRVDPGPLFQLLQEKTPVVIVSWHMGPQRQLMATLRQLDIDGLLAVSKPLALRAESDSLEVVALKDRGLGARFLRRAIDKLRDGGVVAIALDGEQGARHPVPFLGRTVEIGRGTAALVRVAGAELLPLTGRWIGHSGTFETRLHPPLAKPAVDRKEAVQFDTELLATAARFFEDEARRAPGNVSLRRLRKLGQRVVS
ncbi:MAG: hypothetical protein JRG76_09155 [Deltaproteobacteria bacterium]|nr:hypothetical protein [Deltaproteobacteria bacterium]